MIHVGDCVDVMAGMAEASVDAVVTDPPYGLEFMGKDWDRLDTAHRRRDRVDELDDPVKAKYLSHSVEYQGGAVAQAWHQAWATQALRVLKPGGHLLAFGGTRTYHRLACAVEDAGFEVRDMVAWMYGSGFPKSLDVSKAIDGAAGVERLDREVSGPAGNAVFQPTQTVVSAGTPATPEAERWNGYGTALKPAHEPIVVARKPLAGTVAGNVLEHGVGALNVDGCRIGGDGGTRSDSTGEQQGVTYAAGALAGDYGETVPGLGRWPANVVLDEQAAGLLDEQTGELALAGNKPESMGAAGDADPGNTYNWNGGGPSVTFADRGGASRFFYCAKASSAERNAGLNGFDERIVNEATPPGTLGSNSPRAGAGRNGAVRNSHPTVKPINLMRWLTRLVTPPNGTVLDPFTGSGTTGCAAALEGFDFIGIERDEEYAKIAEARIQWWRQREGADTDKVLAALEAADELEQAGQLAFE